MIRRFANTLAGASLLAAAAAAPAPALAQAATAYQLNPAHTGSVKMQTPLTLPLTQLWKHDLGGGVSFPVIADGRVIVYVDDLINGSVSALFAFDQRTGVQLWKRSLPESTGPAYADGTVFVLGQDGTVRAVDAVTGTLNWSRPLTGQYSFDGLPVAANGKVYVDAAGSGGTLYALDAATGKMAWTAAVESSMTTPTVSATTVFTSYTCNAVTAFDAATGATIWAHTPGCSSAGGAVALLDPVFGLFARDALLDNLVLDPTTGKQRGTFAATQTPLAIAGGVAYAQVNYQLIAQDIRTVSRKWTVSPPTGIFTTAPIVVDGRVYIGGSDGSVYAFDTKSGKSVWTGNVGVRVGPIDGAGRPWVGLSAGDGVIAVPAATTLTVFGN